MSKKRRERQVRTPARRKNPQQKSSSSLAIPIVVGLVVVVIIVGAVISIENRRPTAAAVPGDMSMLVATAQPLPTRSIPYPNVPRISLQETKDKLDKGQAVLLDVRSKASYDKAHAAGAISIPEAEVDVRLEELPRDRDVILYCT